MESPFLIGENPAFVQLRKQAEKSWENFNILLLKGPTCCGAWEWAKYLFEKLPQSSFDSFYFQTQGKSVDEAHFWSELKEFVQSSGENIFLSGFSKLDPLMQASVLDWLYQQIQKVPHRIIMQIENLPASAIQSLSFIQRSITLEMIPLSQRKQDIPLVFNAFLKQFNQYFGTAVNSYDSQVIQFIMQYAWPGDLIELRAWVAEQIFHAQGSILSLKDLKRSVFQSVYQSPEYDSGIDVTLFSERKILEFLYEQSPVDLVQVSKFLNLSEQELHQKLLKHGIVAT